MRKTTEIENEIIRKISEAVHVRRSILRQNLPEHDVCIIGKHIVIPNDLRSNEDMQEDKEYQEMMRQGDATVNTVYGLWFKILSPFERAVLEMWYGQNTDWKNVARDLYERGYSTRVYSDRQLMNIRSTGINKIKSHFFN